MRAPMMQSSIDSMRRHPEFRNAVDAYKAGKSVNSYVKKIAHDCQFAEDNVLLVIKLGYR